MSAVIPPSQFPMVDQRTGQITPVWYRFLETLTDLPSARLSADLTYNPPNIAAGGTTIQAVTVPGAQMGWEADAAFSIDLVGLVLTAYVSAENTVTAVFYNPTAGAVNLTEGTLTAYAWKP